MVKSANATQFLTGISTSVSHSGGISMSFLDKYMKTNMGGKIKIHNHF